MKTSGIRSEAHGYSDRGSGSDVTTTAYKGRGALPTETVVPKPQSSAQLKASYGLTSKVARGKNFSCLGVLFYFHLMVYQF